MLGYMLYYFLKYLKSLMTNGPAEGVKILRKSLLMLSFIEGLDGFIFSYEVTI